MDPPFFHELKQLYDELPAVNCTGCGQCCVSPTCTLAEFIYLVRHAQNTLDFPDLQRALLSPPEIHPDYEGNIRCAFLVDGRCSVHPGRTGACRLFGLSSIRELNIPEMEYCRKGIDSGSCAIDADAVGEWLDRLMTIDRGLYASGEAPCFVRAMNLGCWLDIYFDESFDIDVFATIRRTMFDYLDLSAHAAAYRPQTGLKEKVEKIIVLSSMVGRAEAATVNALLISIRDDYPLTGTYYDDEARALLKSLAGDGTEETPKTPCP